MITIQRNLAAGDVIVTPEVSRDLINWRSGPDEVALVGELVTPGGPATLTDRSVRPIPTGEQHYIRIRVEQRQ